MALSRNESKRAIENSKPNAGTPHDWEDYEQQKDKE